MEGIFWTHYDVRIFSYQKFFFTFNTAKTVHDQKLDRWGPRTAQHSVNPVPYDKRLGRKKKFANPKPKEAKLNNIKLWGTQEETDQYVRLCAGEDLRPQKVQDKLYCKYEHRNKPYYR